MRRGATKEDFAAKERIDRKKRNGLRSYLCVLCAPSRQKIFLEMDGSSLLQCKILRQDRPFFILSFWLFILSILRFFAAIPWAWIVVYHTDRGVITASG